MPCGITRGPAPLVALTMLVAGCAFHGSPSPPPPPPYAYDECGDGCAVADHAMAAGGAIAHIRVAAESSGPAAVRSTRPDIVDFSLADGVIEARSGLPGQANLLFLDGGGRVFDVVPVTVAATAKLGFAAASTFAGAVQVLQGSSQVFQVTTQDSNGRTTVGAGSVAFSLEGPLTPVADLVTAGDAQPFAGNAPGPAVVTAYTSGDPAAQVSPATTTLPVDVIDATALVALDAVILPADPAAVAADEVTVEVTARNLHAPVYGAACQWTADSALVLQSQTVATFESPARTTSRFRIIRPGRFTAGCVIGNTTTSVTLRR